jgi:hypothetical protein
MKLQSAMEYLLTYGWMFAILMVVIAILFEYGVFNPSIFYPAVQGGACQVIRPYGPLSTQFISLAGTCTTGIPQSVANMPCAWPNLAICYPNYVVSYLNQTISPMTISAWFWEPPNIEYGGSLISYGGVLVGFNGTYPQLAVGYESGQPYSNELCGGTPSAMQCSPSNVVAGGWNYGVTTINGSTTRVYLNGKLVASGPGAALTGANTAYIGVNASGCRCWLNNGQYEAYYNSGYEADVQIYNSTLTTADVQTLYAEGINGAPVDLPNLIAWWQLNGNANDYSGNGFNGKIYNVTATSQWKNTYIGQPT